MKVIGLTGGIACGKSTISHMLRELGAKVIDADQISHDLTRPGGDGLPAIRKAFGDYVFYPDGDLNRNTLASIVFQNPEERQKLNDALHPLIVKRMQEALETRRKMGTLVVVMDVPLLFEVGLEGLADVTVCASAPQAKQLERLKKRDGLSLEQSMNRIASQWPVSEKEKLSDIVIHTDKPLDELQAEVHQLYHDWVSDET